MTDIWEIFTLAALLWAAMATFYNIHDRLQVRNWELWFARRQPGTWQKVPFGKQKRYLKVIKVHRQKVE